MQSQLSGSGTLLGFIEGERMVFERRVGRDFKYKQGL